MMLTLSCQYIFCPENVVCFLHLLHVFKCTSDNCTSDHGSKHFEPTLIWVHIVCNIWQASKVYKKISD